MNIKQILRNVALILASVTIAAASGTSIPNEVWISPVATGNFYPTNGGTLDSPLDGSTQVNFDTNINALPHNTVIHLLAGVYHTRGVTMQDGQKLIGSAIDATTIQLVSGVPSYTFVIQGGYAGGIEIHDLTCDCNYEADEGAPLTLNGIILSGSTNVVRRVKIINTANYDGADHADAWGIFLDAGNITNSVGNEIEDCEVSHYQGGNGDGDLTGGGGTTPGDLTALSIGAEAGSSCTISGSIRDCHVLGSQGQFILGINGASTHDYLISGNYVLNAYAGVYGDTLGYTNVLIVDNSFISCLHALALANNPSVDFGGRVNINIVNNNIQLAQQPGSGVTVSAFLLNDVGNGFSNICFSANTVSYMGSGGLPYLFEICDGYVINGLTINNNFFDSRLANEYLDTAHAYPLNMNNNYDLLGNFLTSLNIVEVGNVPVTSTGYALLGASTQSSALTSLGLPGSVSALVTNNETQAITFTSNLSVNGNISETAGQAYLYNGVDLADGITSLNDYFFGGAGNLSMTGYQNTGIGSGALASDSSGYDNTASGYQALYSNTSGNWNTANGRQSLQFNSTGANNVANGADALYYNTTGSYNTADGLGSLFEQTTGMYNTANGAESLYLNVYGSYNVADGVFGLYSITNGNYNIGLGFGAGEYLLSGSSNIFIGSFGLTNDNNLIRIGSGQSDTFLSGIVHAPSNFIVAGSSTFAGNVTTSGTNSSTYFFGNGGGLTNVASYALHPLFSAALTNSLIISNSAEQRIWFNNVLSSNSLSYTSTNGVSIAQGGVYKVDVTTAWQGVTSANSYVLYAVLNGADYFRVQGNLSQNNSLILSTVLPLNAGDTLDFHVWQNSGTNVFIAGNASPFYQTYFSIWKIQ